MAREAVRRATCTWPSDDQVMHAARMLAGRVVGVPIAEGRGPVLMLAAYLHCLVRAPVHVVVVDDTLAATLATPLIGVMSLLGVTAAALTDVLLDEATQLRIIGGESVADARQF